MGSLVLVIGLPDIDPGLRKLITWRPIEKCRETGLDVELNSYAKLVIQRLNQFFGYELGLITVSTLYELCEFVIPQVLSISGISKEFDFELLHDDECDCIRVNIPCIEPYSTYLGLVLVASLVDKVKDKEVTIEIYSDYWNKLLDILQFLKIITKNINIVIYSNIFDYSCYYVFDNIYIKQNILVHGSSRAFDDVKVFTIENGVFKGLRSLKEVKKVKLEIPKIEISYEIDDDIKHLITTLAFMNGFAALQTLINQGIEPETIFKAESRDFVKVISIGSVIQVQLTLLGWYVLKLKEESSEK